MEVEGLGGIGGTRAGISGGIEAGCGRPEDMFQGQAWQAAPRVWFRFFTLRLALRKRARFLCAVLRPLSRQVCTTGAERSGDRDAGPGPRLQEAGSRCIVSGAVGP